MVTSRGHQGGVHVDSDIGTKIGTMTKIGTTPAGSLLCGAPRPLRGRYFVAPRDPCGVATLWRPATPAGSLLFGAPRPRRPRDPAKHGPPSTSLLSRPFVTMPMPCRALRRACLRGWAPGTCARTHARGAAWAQQPQPGRAQAPTGRTRISDSDMGRGYRVSLDPSPSWTNRAPGDPR
jgi:hypothetical protein